MDNSRLSVDACFDRTRNISDLSKQSSNGMGKKKGLIKRQNAITERIRKTYPRQLSPKNQSHLIKIYVDSLIKGKQK